MAIGHLVVDGPDHVMYESHVSAVIETCGSVTQSGHQLDRIFRLMRSQALEFGMGERADAAVAELHRAWSLQQGKALPLETEDEEALAAVASVMIGAKGPDFDYMRFLSALEANCGRRPAHNELTSPTVNPSYGGSEINETGERDGSTSSINECPHPLANHDTIFPTAVHQYGGSDFSESREKDGSAYSTDDGPATMALVSETVSRQQPEIKEEFMSPYASSAALPAGDTAATSSHALSLGAKQETGVVINVVGLKGGKSIRRECFKAFSKSGYTGLRHVYRGCWLILLRSEQDARRAATLSFPIGGKSYTPVVYKPVYPEAFLARPPRGISVEEIVGKVADKYRNSFCLQHTRDGARLLLTLVQAIEARNFDLDIQSCGETRTINFQHVVPVVTVSKGCIQCDTCGKAHKPWNLCEPLLVVRPPRGARHLFLPAPSEAPNVEDIRETTLL